MAAVAVLRSNNFTQKLVCGQYLLPCPRTASRFVHTASVVFPNFDDYRLDSTKNPCRSARLTEDDRRGIGHAVFWLGGGILTMMAGKQAVRKAVAFKGMPADVLAQAAVEIDLTQVPEGRGKTFKWRGKPIFVKHRTADEIEQVRSVAINELRDPEPDEKRVQRDKWLVVLGVCTHLGCIPIEGSGDFGGYFCPCHGSHYDASGRIRKGPAPKNLEVPPHEFVSDTILRVGTDK